MFLFLTFILKIMLFIIINVLQLEFTLLFFQGT